MSIRKSFRSGSFYPDNPLEINSMIHSFIIKQKEYSGLEHLSGGIVPHAGWVYSGNIASKVYSTLRKFSYDKVDTFVIYGAVHVYGADKASVYAKGKWETPLGEICIDEELAEQILELDNVVENENIHRTEHSIEVQVPMIKYIFQNIKIVPIMTPPIDSMKTVGENIGKLLSKSGKNVLVIGSTDLTHYGPRFGFVKGGIGQKGLSWMKKNDKKIIDFMLNMETNRILSETKHNRNACGAGAIIAALESLKCMGKNKGTLLEYTTSYDVQPYGEPSDAVGYAGIVF